MIIVIIIEIYNFRTPTSVFGAGDSVCWQEIVGHSFDRMVDLTMSAKVKLPWKWTSSSC